MRAQIMQAIEEADLVVFTVDAREGLTPVDEDIARILRRSGRPVVVAANKVDGGAQEAMLGEVHRLGFPRVMPVSAEHGRGVAELLEAIREAAPPPVTETSAEGPRVAIVGRPNVGKSSLVNAVLGQPRVLVHAAPGTTRDSVDTPLTFRGRPYILIDTAGIRRKGKVSEALEKLSVVMALKSLERCQVAVLLLDASEGVTAQDAHIAGYAHDAGRALVIVVNKWDLVPPNMVTRAGRHGPDSRPAAVPRLRAGMLHLRREGRRARRSLRHRGPRGRGGPAPRAARRAARALPRRARAPPHVVGRGAVAHPVRAAGRGVAAHLRAAREPARQDPLLVRALPRELPPPRAPLRGLARSAPLPEERRPAERRSQGGARPPLNPRNRLALSPAVLRWRSR
jgi:small GTP-binding protein